MSSIPTRSRAFVALGVVVAVAFALRLIGFGHELPQHPDEDSLIVTQAESLRGQFAGDPQAEHVEPHYPLVLATTLALLPLPANDPQREAAAPKDYHLERAAVGFERGRVLVALLSSLAVPLSWLVARRFVDVRWATFAAALLATSLLHLRLSQSARPHGVLGTWILLALWLDLRLLERGRWRDHLLAGGATALAVGCLHNGASAFLPLAAAQLTRWRRDGRAALPGALAAWAVVAAVTWLAYLAPLPHVRAPELSGSGMLTLSGHEFPLAVFDGGGFARMLPMLAQTDPVLLAAGLAGVAFALAGLVHERRLPGLPARVLLAWALPYLVVMGLYNRLPARFLLPLLPLLALCATLPMQALAASCARRAGALARAAPLAAALALLALPSYAGARLAWLNARPEAADEVAAWLERHADPRRDLLYLNASANLPLLMREEGGGPLFGAPFAAWDTYLSRLQPQFLDAHAWRTRRLIAGDSRDIGSLHQDEASLLEILHAPPAEPVRKRFAVVALNRNTGAQDQAHRAVLAAGGREVFRFVVESRPCQPHPLALDASASLPKLLCTRRLGISTVIYELPDLELRSPSGPPAGGMSSE